MGGGFILLIILGLAGALVQFRLRSKFKKYSNIQLSCNLSGKEIAEKMLNENSIHDVSITCVEGIMTDHYNPTDKTVNLSPDVYNGRTIAAAAIAAHECGHAVQHATMYSWLQMRSALVPIVHSSSKWIMICIIGGILLISVFPYLLLIGIILFATTTLFSFITLPVEFDASKRAVAWLQNSNITHSNEENTGVRDALSWAAATYLVAAIGSLATLLYYIGIFNDSE